MTIKLQKNGRTVIVDEGSRNHYHFLAQGFTDPSAQTTEPTPELTHEPEAIPYPQTLETQEPKKPARRPRKKKTDEG